MKDHAGDQGDPAHDDHVVCPSCELEKSLILSFGGDDMIRFFEHVGKVEDDDTYAKTIKKVE